jgi:transposase
MIGNESRNLRKSPEEVADIRPESPADFSGMRKHGSQYAAIRSIAAKIGCSGETLRNWVRQAEHDRGVRAGPTMDERERIKALERENRELRQANEILRKASAYFAQAELDRRSKP